MNNATNEAILKARRAKILELATQNNTIGDAYQDLVRAINAGGMRQAEKVLQQALEATGINSTEASQLVVSAATMAVTDIHDHISTKPLTKDEEPFLG